jgi:LmbE family N-acetylglucosaminyl deacetylase
MQTPPETRRNFLKQSLAIAAPMVAAAASQLPAEASGGAGLRPLKVCCVGAHPDDPESGCAGTLARYGQLGHSVAVVYLTRGERGIRGKSLDEAARIRSQECKTACEIMGARPIFFGQIDGATEVNQTHVDAMSRLLAEQAPDVVFTHWPIDTHMDHQVASLLAIRACMAQQPQPRLFFFEVNTGSQTRGFLPNTYVDVSSVIEKKKAALLAHVSQDGLGVWRQHHEPVAIWRGREAGVAMAEAFVHLTRDSPFTKLPGI